MALELEIDETFVNKLGTDMRGISTLEALEALEIFTHLSEEDADDANEELLAELSSFNGTVITPVLSLAHTNGVANAFAGVDSLASSSVGAGTDGNGGLVLTPINANWDTATVPARLIKFTVKTNIVADDCSSDANPATNGIVVKIAHAYMVDASTALSAFMRLLSFGKTGFNGAYGTGHIVSGGPSYAGNVGDTGTFWAEYVIADPGTNIYEIGLGGPIGSYYYTYAVTCASSAITKTFKFIVELEYE